MGRHSDSVTHAANFGFGGEILTSKTEIPSLM